MHGSRVYVAALTCTADDGRGILSDWWHRYIYSGGVYICYEAIYAECYSHGCVLVGMYGGRDK